MLLGQGQVVKVETPLPVVPKPAAKVAHSVGRPASRRKPGRPKAGKLDAPVASPEPAVAVSAKPHPTTPGDRRRLSDLTPAARTAAAPTAPAAKTPAAPARAGARPAIGYGHILGLSLHERFRPGVLVWALVPATLLALAAGGLTWLLINGHIQAAVITTRRAGWPVWGELLLAAALYYVSHALAGAAMIFGVARRTDHRPATLHHQLIAAINSLGAWIRFDSSVIVLQLIVVALAVGLALIGGATWPMPQLAHLSLLFVGFLLLGYILIGLGLMQGLGRVGLTLAGLSARRALAISARFIVHHFELTGFKVLSWIIELVLLLPIFGVIVALATLLPPNWRWTAAPAAVVLTILGGALLGAGTAVWWLAVYRSLVRAGRPGQALGLLTAHQPNQPRRFALVSTWLTLVILSLAAAAWPWLPASLFGH